MNANPSSPDTQPNASQCGMLDPIQARVLGTLMEKARTVPDSYPMTLNSLLLGCNQKTSREPVMELGEAQVLAALAELRQTNLVRENSGGRSVRFEHNFQRGIGVYEQAAVLLGLLMLRGPQTSAELRLNAQRWYQFADVSSVEGFLEELQDRPKKKGGPLVQQLPKAPGEREPRWAHLLCGAVNTAMQQGYAARAGGESAHLHTPERIAALEAEVARMRALVDHLYAELGLQAPPQS